jgi:hypothetical protein
MNLLAQPVRGGAQNHDACSQPTRKPADKEVLRGYVERMVKEKLAVQRKQTPRKTRPPRGGQGAGAKRELAHLQKDAAASKPCEHCGRMHAGECWFKPGSKKRNRAERKALKVAADLSKAESGEDAGSEVEESDDKYSCVSLLPPSSRIPRTCTVLRANLLLQTPSAMRTPTHRRRSLSPTDPSTSCANTSAVRSCRARSASPRLHNTLTWPFG